MNYLLFKSQLIKGKLREIKSHGSESLHRMGGGAHMPFIYCFQNCKDETPEETQTCKRSKPSSWLSERAVPGHPSQACRPAGAQAKHSCPSLILQLGAPTQGAAAGEGCPWHHGLARIVPASVAGSISAQPCSQPRPRTLAAAVWNGRSSHVAASQLGLCLCFDKGGWFSTTVCSLSERIFCREAVMRSVCMLPWEGRGAWQVCFFHKWKISRQLLIQLGWYRAVICLGKTIFLFLLHSKKLLYTCSSCVGGMYQDTAVSPSGPRWFLQGDALSCVCFQRTVLPGWRSQTCKYHSITVFASPSPSRADPVEGAAV